MFFLAGSIILTAYLTLAFKVLQRLGLDAFQAIVFNYFTCVITGSIVNGSFTIDADAVESGWFGWSCLLGCMFIVLFNLVAITTQRINVAVAAVAYKVSLVIPFIFSIFLYNENIAGKQWLGITAALVGVVFTFIPNDQTGKKNIANKSLLYLLPVILFIGSGLQDTIIQYVERTYLNDSNKNASLITSFSAAAIIGIVVLLVQVNLIAHNDAKEDNACCKFATSWCVAANR
jgi:drug/metabolite transporter (DMT)-like permease